MIGVEPLDLIVDAMQFARDEAIGERLQIERRDAPRQHAVLDEAALESQPLAVRRQCRTLDAGAQHGGLALADAALDQKLFLPGPQRGVERVGILREGHAPEIEVGGFEYLAVARDGELLELANQLPRRRVGERRQGRERSRRVPSDLRRTP